MRLKRLFLTVLSVLALSIISVWAWSQWPISADPNRSDPAVILANELGSPEFPYSEGYVGEAGTRLHYVSAGQGEVIIFLHGFPSYWFTMYGLTEAFKSDYRVIAVDGLGVGQSDAPNNVDAYRLESMVGYLDSLVNELGEKEVNLVGHDWGGVIATSYAKTHPSKVKTLTNISGPPHDIILSRLQTDPEHREVFSYVSEFKKANPILIKLLGIKDDIWDAVYEEYVKSGVLSEKQAERLYLDIGNPRRLNRLIHWYRANIPNYEDITEFDFWPSRETRLTVPSLFTYSLDDRVITSGIVEDFEAMSDSLSLLGFENAGHRPHFVEEALVAQAIREHIESNNP